MISKVRKRTFGHVRLLNITISLIRAVSSESSLGEFWIAKYAKPLHSDKEDSDQTAQMLRWAHMSKVTFFASHYGSTGC